MARGHWEIGETKFGRAVSVAIMELPVRRWSSVCVGVLMLLLSPFSSGQDALQLFHKMQTALGGVERIGSIRDFDESVRAEAWYNDGRPLGAVRKRTRWLRPNCLRLDQLGPTDTYVLYFDGTSGWEILPDKTVANLAGGELKFAQNYLRGLNLNFWLADRDSSRVITSLASNVIVISTKGDSSQRTELHARSGDISTDEGDRHLTFRP
jgi:hypothetical protein